MSATSNSPRRGIALAGNWIVDHVKIIDTWPSPSHLANILAESMGTGGAPFNDILNIAALEPSIALEGIGLVGDDDDGHWIRAKMEGIADCAGLKVCPGAATSYTDVMTLQEGGDRTFFHLRGANASFDIEHVDLSRSNAKIFHFGYLLLLDRFDRTDPEYGTRAARLLAQSREAGLLNSIDVVSAETGFAEIVGPALRYTDLCIVNEVEAGGTTGMSLRDGNDRPDWNAIERAARRIAELGVTTHVTIHLPEGAVSLDVKENQLFRSSSFVLPPGFIKGSAGAGDAFCSGMLIGLHEGWDLPRTLRLAHAAAAASLRVSTCTGGIQSMAETLALADSLSQSNDEN